MCQMRGYGLQRMGGVIFKIFNNPQAPTTGADAAGLGAAATWEGNLRSGREVGAVCGAGGGAPGWRRCAQRSSYVSVWTNRKIFQCRGGRK